MKPTFRLLFGLLIVRHDRRRLLWFGATTHPSAEWIGRQCTEAFGWEEAPRYLVRDRSYGEVFVWRVRAMGIRDRPISPRSPWQNGFAERLIGSIRRECIDHVIVFGERHLRHLLRSYLDYYNETRTHLSFDKDTPISRAVEVVGRISGGPVLGWIASPIRADLIPDRHSAMVTLRPVPIVKPWPILPFNWGRRPYDTFSGCSLSAVLGLPKS